MAFRSKRDSAKANLPKSDSSQTDSSPADSGRNLPAYPEAETGPAPTRDSGGAAAERGSEPESKLGPGLGPDPESGPAELEICRERLDRALWAARLAWWEWDVETGRVDCSPRKLEMLGFSPGEIAPSVDAFIHLIHPEDRESAMTAMREHLRGNRPVYEIRYRLRTREGGWKWLQDRGRVSARDEGGRPVRVAGAVQDIDEIKRAEAERDWLFNLSSDLFAVSDLEGTFRQVNPAWSWMLGWTAGELVGRPWAELFHPEDREAGEAALKRLASGRPLSELELRHRHRGGGWRWLSWNAEPRLAEGRIYGTARDITEQKSRKADLEQYRDHLEELVDRRTAELTEINGRLAREVGQRRRAEDRLRRRTEALGRSNADLEQFAYIASHDLQEPLRKVRAFGDRLNTKYGHCLEERGRDYLERMRSAAERMQNMINELLTLSRVSTRGRAFAKTDLDGLLAEALSDLELQIERTGGRVSAGPLPRLFADPAQIRQVFANLVGNALKFHREGVPPEVRISSEAEPGEPPPAWRIRIADNGIGFEASQADRIFQPFQRLHGRGEYEGSGIGLAICRKIVERHGGVLTATSAPGEGSTFEIRLPVHPPSGSPST
jgi:PAS domain S-box-containing protein